MAANPPGHEYLPILGLPAFRTAAQRVIFGDDSTLLSSNRVATLQTISGTGAVHIAAAFLRQFHHPIGITGSPTIYISDPSWSNHRIMFEYVGFKVLDYPYYDASSRGVNFEGMKQSLESANPGDVYILHACAHNPTGCDLTSEQWREAGEIIKRKRLVPLLDSAYQGFASGDLDKDAYSIRYLLEELNIPGIVCQSFSKSMGLYGERVGAVHITIPPSSSPSPKTSSPGAIESIESQLGWISRKELSTPPRYGATIASTIITSPDLYDQWRADLVTMSRRVQAMRERVVSTLTKLGTPGTWTHVTDQIGMFSYTGIPREAVMQLRQRHVYMAENGRMSVAGLNEGNVDYFCRMVHEVLTGGGEV